jgi:hypothetical protein
MPELFNIMGAETTWCHNWPYYPNMYRLNSKNYSLYLHNAIFLKDIARWFHIGLWVS